MNINQQGIAPQVSTLRNLSIAVLLMLGCYVSASAQWTTNGNDISNTNSGNVGVGTTTPNALLEVKKSQNGATAISVDNPFTTSGNTAFSAVILKQSGVSRLQIASVNDNHSFLTAGTAQFWNFANAPTVFATNNAERMRLTSGGNLGIGTTSPNERLVTLGNMLVGNITSHTQLYSTFDSQANMILEVGYGTATSNIVPLPTLVLSKNLTSINNPIGSFSFANSNIADGNEKRIAYLTAWTDGALNSGALMFGTAAAGTLNERLRITSGGNIGIGTTAPLYSLDVNGGTKGFRAKAATTSANDAIATFENSSAVKMIVLGDGKVGIGRSDPTKTLDVVGDINASGTITAGNIKANYQDLAEWVESSQELPAGTVVVLNPAKSNQVIASTQSYDSRVAGVISLQPGIALGQEGEGRVLVATTGRVKVKVDTSNGPINIGDLLVTSNNEGVAMKSVPVEISDVRIHRPGTLIGKALEPWTQGTGEILVLLSLQ